jgi:nitrogen fixation protein NifU and related proteins
MENATAEASVANPLCGDALAVMVRLDSQQIADVSFQGQGCSIATASASLMTEAVVHRSVEEALTLVEGMQAMLRGESELALPDALEPLRAAIPFGGRHRCVLLPWQALREALV